MAEKKRERLDWRRSTEEHRHEEDVFEELSSLIPPRIRAEGLAMASVFGLIRNDIEAECAGVQRCPKCRRRTLRKIYPARKASPRDSSRVCSHCGNDCDEFGNRL